jgi:protein TonB
MFRYHADNHKNIYTYIQKNINYPLNSDQYETGKIFIKFIVDTDGSLTNFKILKGLESWNNEAIRVIKSMPKWEPAKCNGKKVPYLFISPVNINPY